ncbi:MAG: PDZ domain-containing protein [Planctomycetaceae bacterium]|jgi:hypothetical protein|nr:PDZ domain-containing protein [Planctomycetaceae bacterium]
MIHSPTFRFVFTFFVFAVLTGTAAAQTVHFIGVADIHSNLAVFVKDDIRRMNDTFGGGINAKQVAFHLLKDKGQDITPDGVLQLIKRLPNVQRTDTVVFYYTGHGAMDNAKGLFYTISDPAHSFQQSGNDFIKYVKPLLKKDVIAAIQAHSPKLTVIISDCCSMKAKYDVVAAGASKREPKQLADPTLPLFRSLFFEPSGLVDFTAAQDGEPGLCYPASAENAGKFGSVLTNCLADQLNSMKNTAAAWETFFPKVQAASKADADKYCGERMIPKAFSLGNTRRTVDTARPKHKFGVRAMTRDDGKGVMVTEVVQGLPGALAGLEQGDVILEIDGKTLRNEQDYSDAVDAAGETMTMKIRNARDHQTLEAKAVFSNP